VPGCPPRRQDAIAAPRGPRESGSQQACGFHFHLTRATGTGADVRQPWLRGRIAASMKSKLVRGGGRREIEEEMAVEEEVIRFPI
jgi:hypothetical protein